jgi:hypothetical protein
MPLLLLAQVRKGIVPSAAQPSLTGKKVVTQKVFVQKRTYGKS